MDKASSILRWIGRRVDNAKLVHHGSGTAIAQGRAAMPNYRRARVPGATYFFTVNLRDRQNDLLIREIDLLRAKKGTDLFSPSPFSTVFALTASHFLFARAKEKVTKEKARPASGFRYAQLPSLRHCSEGRHGGPSLAHRSSFGIHAKRPSPQHLHSAS